jgi:hypothetical protein
MFRKQNDTVCIDHGSLPFLPATDEGQSKNFTQTIISKVCCSDENCL